MTLQAVVLRRRSRVAVAVWIVTAVLVATVVRWALSALFQGRMPWASYSVAVFLLSIVGGRWAGAVTALLGVVAGLALAAAEPAWHAVAVADERAAAVFLCVAAIVTWLGGAVRTAFHELETRRAELEIELTRRRTLEIELRDADRRKNEFLAMLAHELRNPLAPIRAAVHVMRRVDPADPAVAQAREMIDRQAVHMTRLIEDLLQIARITRGLIELKPERLELADVVRDAVEPARPLIAARGHELSVDLGPTPWALDGDRARLVQAISNVVVNAAKFTPPGGRVAITARPADAGRVALAVEDTGVGVPDALHDRVFELFEQGNAGVSRSHGGLGIGLTLCKRLVEMHGGRVSLASGGRDRGTRVTIELPAAPASAPQPDAPAAPSAVATDTSRVLVVEDLPDARDSLVLLLRLDGHTVRAAGSVGEALEIVEQFTPDVAFVDLGLPDMDGHALARRLRADPRTAEAVLIALTGWGSEADKERSRRAGFDRHLTKPADDAAIRAALHARRRARSAADATHDPAA